MKSMSALETKPRNPIFNPEEGDILQMPNGVYVLVDFHESLRTAFTRSDGVVGAYDYLAGWSRDMEGSKVIQLGSPETWPWHYTGWLKVPFPESYRDHLRHTPTLKESLAFIERRASEEYRVWCTFGGEPCPQSS